MLKQYRYILIFSFFITLSSLPIFSQEILTAISYFNSVSEQYGKVDDYEAMVVITNSSGVMEGALFYKNPNLLRINFTKPADQVLVVDGQMLTLHLPELRVTMTQQLRRRSTAGVASMASAQGLHLLSRRYSISYMTEAGSVPTPLDNTPGSDLVVKLKLEWRSIDEGFRQIELAVDDQTKLIRRITGITPDFERVQLDFIDVMINRGIPDGRFNYESPKTANRYHNFLFEPEE